MYPSKSKIPYLTDLSYEVRNRSAADAKPDASAHHRYVLVSLDPDIWRCQDCLVYLEGRKSADRLF